MAGVICDQVDSLELNEMDRGEREKKNVNVNTVYALPERRRGRRCFRLAAAAVCLGLLCVLLMITIILRHMYHVHLKEEKDNLTKERDQLKISNQNLTKERDQLKAKNSCRKLTEDSTLQTGSGDLDQSPGVKRCMESGSCYLLVFGWRNWEDSRKDCRERGGYLVIINSVEEQKFLYDVFGSSVFWIGLSEAEDEKVWKWVDGSKLILFFSSSYWISGEPNNSGRFQEENCVAFMSSDERSSTLQTWNDMNCSIKRSWVCELKPAGQ